MSRKPAPKTSTRHNPIHALTMIEAMHNGLTLIRDDKWREHQRRSMKSGFLRWNEETKAGVHLWSDLKPIHIRNFVLWMERDMKWKRNTVSHYTNVIRKSSEWVQLNMPDQWENPFIRKMRREPEPSSDRYLMPDQLAQVVKVAKEMNETSVVAALMFGGLAGIGLLELLDMKAEDITADGIRITRPKNAYRPRIVPMCEPLKTYALAWKNCFGRVPARGDYSLSKRGRLVLDATAERTKDETFRMVNLHEATRVTFANTAKVAGVPAESLAAYLGHVGTSTLEKHYLKLIPRHDDLPRIQKQKLAQLSADVCKPLNRKLSNTTFH